MAASLRKSLPEVDSTLRQTSVAPLAAGEGFHPVVQSPELVNQEQ